MTAESRRGRILVGGGAIAVSVGTYLSWLRTNPNLPPDAEIPTILLPGMNAGFEAFDFALLGSVGLVLLLRGVGSRKRLRSLATLLTGAGIVMFCVSYLSRSSLAGFGATFVPALG
ncbi:hypothetical protein [Haladaptatus salinisoli]|uniref:hypothetical protein n=1 Tax=Haladaptatus salinisoli TaxID=2884876 RepID=UPI001D0A069B|nr:hypothetical protein [Haladaptatus salinisoli]